METESVKIDKKIVDKVRRLKKKDSSINIGGFIGKAVLNELERIKNPTPQQYPFPQINPRPNHQF